MLPAAESVAVMLSFPWIREAVGDATKLQQHADFGHPTGMMRNVDEQGRRV
jgi:hypothetical protein